MSMVLVLIHTRLPRTDINSIVGASIDGPGGSIVAAIYSLIKYPRAFHKLRDEVDAGLPAVSDMGTGQEHAIPESLHRRSHASLSASRDRPHPSNTA